jgi:hypothetical protein
VLPVDLHGVTVLALEMNDVSGTVEMDRSVLLQDPAAINVGGEDAQHFLRRIPALG